MKHGCVKTTTLTCLFLCMMIGVACNRKDSPVVKWDHTFGGAKDEEAKAIIATADGGLAFCGWTASSDSGKNDAWIVRLNKEGQRLWEKTYGDSAADEATALAELKSGGFIVSGAKTINGKADAWLLRLDDRGELLWEKNYGGKEFDKAESFVVTVDGDFVVCGGTRSQGAGLLDAWIFRVDSTGNLLWEKTFGGEKFDRINSIITMPEGGFAVCGQTSSSGAGSVDFWLMRLDSQGQVLWEKTFGGAKPDWGEKVIRTTDGGFAFCGETQSQGAGEWDVWVLRLNNTGEILWDKIFGGAKNDWANAIVQTSDGGFLLCGITASKGLDEDEAWVLRLDAEGNLLWDKPMGGAQHENTYAITATSAGEYVFAGATSSKGAGGKDGWVIKLK